MRRVRTLFQLKPVQWLCGVMQRWQHLLHPIINKSSLTSKNAGLGAKEMNRLSEYVFLSLLMFVIRAAGDMLEWLLTGMTECLRLQEWYQLRQHHQMLHSECLHLAALLRFCVFSLYPPFSRLPFRLISASLFLLSPPWKDILEVRLIIVSCNSSKM